MHDDIENRSINIFNTKDKAVINCFGKFVLGPLKKTEKINTQHTHKGNLSLFFTETLAYISIHKISVLKIKTSEDIKNINR